MKGLRAVVTLLKSSGEQMKLKEIVQQTSELVNWPTVPTHLMTRIMETDSRVVRVGRGFYVYKSPAKSDTKQEKKQEAPVANIAAPPKPAAKPTPAPAAPPAPPAEPPKAAPPEMPDKRLKVGEIYDGIVTRVQSYGCFVEIQGHNASGLLHVTNMKRGVYFWRIEDIERYFQVGDEIKVKLITYRNNKASLCTYDLPLPDHGPTDPTPIGEKLTPVADKLTPAAKPAAPPAAPAAPVSITKDELEDLYEMIRKKVGVLSLTAKDALKEAVKKHGPVKMTMALMGADDFEADVSLAFVKHVDAKVTGGL